ncbi:MAG: hypothetical protein ACJA2U_002201 [Marinomonas primoryensis]|jgi:hypothetical protein
MLVHWVMSQHTLMTNYNFILQNVAFYTIKRHLERGTNKWLN